MSNFQTYYHFQLDFQNSGPTYRRQVVNPHHQTQQRKISCKAQNSPVKYPSRERKDDIKASEGNMFNPILMENVQGQEHPGSCAFAEQALLSSRKPKSEV